MIKSGQKSPVTPFSRKFSMLKNMAVVSLAIIGQSFPVTSSAQVSGPTDNKGTTSRSLGQINLKGEIDEIGDRQLRSRYITIEPGGHSAAHSHAGRPTLEYVAQGHVIEVRNGVDTPHGPGEMIIATHDISHWWENRGTETVVLIPVDIFKP